MKVLFHVEGLYTGPKDVITGSNGRPFYNVKYKFMIMFGQTEVTAQIAWMDNVSILTPRPSFPLISFSPKYREF
jgi:hypothetical protein